MTQALTFNDITLTIIFHQNSLWIRAAELARALGLSREDKVAQIYQRHADEFTSDMTQLIENVVEPQNEVFQNLSAGRCRIFSLRGCHLVAMFARTPVAKAFRRWVLDVLEKYAAEQTALSAPGPDAALTPDQQCTLQAVVKGKVESIPADRRPRGLYPQIWSRFNNHFRLASYKQLPQSRLSEGIAYLMAMELPAALPTGKESLTVAPAPAPYTPPVDMSSGRADALRRIESAIRTINAAQDVVRLFCHPGPKTMRMSPWERAMYDAEHQLYANAIDTLYAARCTLEAGHALERLRSPQPGRSLPAGRM